MFIVGFDYENMSEWCKGYENFVMVNGVLQYGEQGVLCCNECNLMWNVDFYLQIQWQFIDKFLFDVGVCYSLVWFDLNDYYIILGNGDDSGDVSYYKWLFVGLLKYVLIDVWNVYFFVGCGFEMLIINEFFYCFDNQSGFNFGLKFFINDMVEIGSKMWIGNGLFIVVLFQINIDNEIVVDSSSGGCISYKNVGKICCQGMELGLDQQFGESWCLKVVWIWLDVIYCINVCDDVSCNGNCILGIVCNMGYVFFGYQLE